VFIHFLTCGGSDVPTKPLDLPESPAGQRLSRVRLAWRVARKRRMINYGG